MDFRIADTFTDRLARLSGDEQKAVKTTAFDLQLNPANPGMSLHKLDNARDSNFWLVRVNADIRLIVHRANEVYCSATAFRRSGSGTCSRQRRTRCSTWSTISRPKRPRLYLSWRRAANQG
jgi:mRNA-degrading endonuclease RelE of RelBE toxin-antitoxin system